MEEYKKILWIMWLSFLIAGGVYVFADGIISSKSFNIAAGAFIIVVNIISLVFATKTIDEN